MERKLAREGLKSDPTVKEFAERYYTEQVLSELEGSEDTSGAISITRSFPSSETRQLKDVTPLDVQNLVYRKRDNGHVAAAIQLRGVIKRMFDYAIETHLVTSNPAAMVATRYHRQSTQAVPCSDAEEIRTLPPHHLRFEHSTPIQACPAHHPFDASAASPSYCLPSGSTSTLKKASGLFPQGTRREASRTLSTFPSKSRRCSRIEGACRRF